jgi:type I restriction enzyme M protein
MISIRSNFFYTRTVPCELWHFDKGKPEERRDQVLMLDARNIYRKVTRKIYDFSPEQLANLTAIVWLYRGEQDRFLGLVRGYFVALCEAAAGITGALAAFETGLGTLDDSANQAYRTDRSDLTTKLEAFVAQYQTALLATNADQHAARQAFDPLAEGVRGLIKQVDLLYKLAAADGEACDRKRLKQLDEERKQAVEQLKQAAYFHRQIHWLQERFPDAVMQAVPGLCKVVSRADIEAADWSLTPGRYVGVAPADVDEDFDFEQTLKDIHVELADLNREAVELAARIQENFEELGV